MVQLKKEVLILNQLITNTEYRNIVLFYLESDYFQQRSIKILFECIRDYITKYKTSPSKEALIISLKQNNNGFDDELLKQFSDYIENDLYKQETQEFQWLLDITEEFCRTQAIYNGLLKSIEIHNGTNKQVSIDIIPDILRSALNISFDSKIGVDYLDSFKERFDFYTSTESGIPFDLVILNDATNGIGLPRKGITILMSATHAGKTLCKCHIAASALKQGYNVLYITLEMPANRIAQRIDANLLDMEMDNIIKLKEDDYIKKMTKIKTTCKGRLFIEEFPTSIGNSNHFRKLIEDLKNKKGFNVDLLIVDYINICASAKYKSGSYGNTYTPIKSVAEELRALGMEFNCAVLSSTQSNRDGLSDLNSGLESVAESMGIAHTADIFWKIYRNEQLDDLNKILIIQLKNRLKDLSLQRRFLLQINKSKMKLYDVLNKDDDVTSFLTPNTREEHTQVTAKHFKGKSNDGFSSFTF